MSRRAIVQRHKLDYDPRAQWRLDSRSEASFEARSVILNRFLKFHKTNDEELLSLASKTPYGKPQFQIQKMVGDFLDYRAGRGYATSTVAKEAAIISGFLRANNVIIKTGKKYVLKSVYESRHVPTQIEVQRMIEKTPGLEEKAVICFLAQTAQRVGILTGLKWNMIHRCRVKGTDRIYGVAEVMSDISDRNGRLVNKTRQQYSFGIHWQSMKLLDELEARQKASARSNDPFIWSMNKRRMQEAVSEAAEKAGIQVETERKLKVEEKDRKGKKIIKKRKWHQIHAHVFRRFWMDRMDTAGITQEKLLDYQLGHDIRDSTYRHGYFTDKKIIKAMKQADKELRVLPKG